MGEKEDALIKAVTNGNTEVVQKLINEGADVNYKVKIGDTTLNITAEKDQINVFEKLIRVEDSDKDNQNNTESNVAENSGIFIDAEINLQTNKGKTALQVAEQKGHTEIAEILKKAGAVE